MFPEQRFLKYCSSSGPGQYKLRQWHFHPRSVLQGYQKQNGNRKDGSLKIKPRPGDTRVLKGTWLVLRESLIKGPCPQDTFTVSRPAHPSPRVHRRKQTWRHTQRDGRADGRALSAHYRTQHRDGVENEINTWHQRTQLWSIHMFLCSK